MNPRQHMITLTVAALLLTGCDRGAPEGIIVTPLPPTINPLAPDFTSLEQCMIYQWTLGAEQVDNVFENSRMATLPGFSSTIAGQGIVEFLADGTYKYSPNFTMSITVQGQRGTGQWSGILLGKWSVSGDVLTMTQTSNSITGTYTMYGSARPLPVPASFNGTARVIECTPATLKYELSAPTGAFIQTLVH